MSASRLKGCLLGTPVAVGAAVLVALRGLRARRAPVATERIELLDVPVDPVTMEEALGRLEAFIRSGQPHHVFTADASGIMQAQEDPELREAVRQADLVTPDGAGVMLASGLRGTRLPERVSGVDLVEGLCALAAEKGRRVYFFGAKEGVAQAAAAALAARHPGLPVAGIRHGYFSPREEPEIVADIAAAKPHILFVALGIPRQELFIRRHFAALGVPVMIGIGGSFDVISGRLKRAPRWMRRGGLEWLYRALQEPSRLPRLTALPRFVLAVWRERRGR